MRRRPADVLAAGIAGAVVSGFPSTLWTLAERGDPLEGGRALGRVLLPREERTLVLLVAAGAVIEPAHLEQADGPLAEWLQARRPR